MDKKTLDLKKKLTYIFHHLDALYLFRNEPVRDQGKRAILRFFFIQIDNLLKHAGRLQNRLAQDGALGSVGKNGVKTAIARLRNSYEGSFDLIRDKLTAHAQLADLGSALAWWKDIDYSTIEVLYGDIKDVESAFKDAKDMAFQSFGSDYRPLNIPDTNHLSPQSQRIHIDAGRLGLASDDAVGIITLSPTHEKAQLVVATLEMIRFDFALTCLVHHCQTQYTTRLFDAGWLLALVDTCSLIDNLFVPSSIDGPSLLEQWRSAGFRGTTALDQLNSNRDATLETELRHLRNKIAAHMDDKIPFDDLYGEFRDYEYRKIHHYVHFLSNGFLTACRCDIRTKTFAIHGMELDDVTQLQKISIPFDDV